MPPIIGFKIHFPAPPSLSHIPENLEALPDLNPLPQIQLDGLWGRDPARWTRETRQHSPRYVSSLCWVHTGFFISGGSPLTLMGEESILHTPSILSLPPTLPLYACV